jgi:hypothetical protein
LALSWHLGCQDREWTRYLCEGRYIDLSADLGEFLIGHFLFADILLELRQCLIQTKQSSVALAENALHR